MTMKINPKCHQRGFTLLELMVVVVIIAILAAFAYPSFRGYLQKGHRAEARAALLEAASQLNRYYAQKHTFEGANVGLPTASPSTGTKRYNINVKISDNGSSFILSAVPVDNTAKCGILTLTNTGVQGVSDGTVADCW